MLEKILITFQFEYLIEIYNFIIENFISLLNHLNGLCNIKQTLILKNKKEFYDNKQLFLLEKNSFNFVIFIGLKFR